MNLYYFNKNTDSKGNHEVHRDDCRFLPSSENRTYIGLFSTCEEAIKKAKESYPYETFDGCYHCCRSCHKG